MAKGSGGTRTSRPSASKRAQGYSYERETDKAVMVNVSINAEYAPEGGFVSSMVRDKIIKQKVWLPKSQFEDGSPTNYILRAKAQQLAEKYTPWNGRVLNISYRYTDNGGKLMVGVKSAREKQWDKERAERAAANRKAGAEKAAQTRAANKGLRSSTKIAAGSNVSSTKYGAGVIQRIITKSTGYVQVRYDDGSVRKEMAFNLKGEDGKPLKLKPNK